MCQRLLKPVHSFIKNVLARLPYLLPLVEQTGVTEVRNGCSSGYLTFGRRTIDKGTGGRRRRELMVHTGKNELSPSIGMD